MLMRGASKIFRYYGGHSDSRTRTLAMTASLSRQKHVVMRVPETRPSEWQSKRAFRRISSMCTTAIPVALQPHNLVLLYIHVHRQSNLPEVTCFNSKRSPLFRRADCWPSDWTVVSYVRICVFGLTVIYLPDHRHAQHAVPPPLPSSLLTQSLCFINSRFVQVGPGQ